MRLTHGFLFFVLLFLSPVLLLDAGEHRLFEIPNTRVVPIQASQSGKQYELYIKLPEGYTEHPTTSYPVIYFTDAMWHFEILSASTAFLMPDVILVGISWQKDIGEELRAEFGEHAARFRDYSIKKLARPDMQAKYQYGQAGSHLAFIRNDVFPYIEKHFRTLPKRRTYFGYSLGGLFGTYVLLAEPETFQNYILGSPVIDNSVFNFASPALKSQKKRGTNVFISVGEKEKSRIEKIQAFLSELKTRAYQGISLQHVVIDAADHGTAFPATGVRSVDWLSKLPKGTEE